MITRVIKYGVAGAVVLGLAGAFMFGRDVFSYAGSTAKSVKSAMKDAVPIEFELQRARDLLEQIIPEMQANVRLIAQEEVEVASLGRDIEQCRNSLSQERTRLASLREVLATEKVSYSLGGMQFTREHVKQELARHFDAMKETEQVLAGKQRLLETRQRSLQAAMQVLDRTRSEKVRLQDQIAALESQHRLVKAAAVGSQFEIDNSKLAQTERLLGEIRKRLDVAERVLAHEARFTQPIPIDVINEKDLVTEVDEYLASSQRPTTQPAAQPVAMGERD